MKRKREEVTAEPNPEARIDGLPYRVVRGNRVLQKCASHEIAQDLADRINRVDS